MKKTLVVVLLILTVLTGCANTEYNSDDAIKLCAQTWGSLCI